MMLISHWDSFYEIAFITNGISYSLNLSREKYIKLNFDIRDDNYMVHKEIVVYNGIKS